MSISKRGLALLSLFLLAYTSMIAIPSYFNSYSIGIDIDFENSDPETITHTLNHIYWPGTGSLWLYTVGYHVEPKGSPYRIDPGSLFFGPQNPVGQPRTTWQRFGFWGSWGADDNLKDPHAVWEYWIGIPSWIPIPLLLYALLNKRRSQGQPAQPD